MPELSVLAYILLFFTALFAGFVDSIAGGGGIITIPAFLALGIPPHVALGTNKLQASFGSCTATINYRRGGLVHARHVMSGILWTAIGAILGAIAIQSLSAALLEKAIPLLLIIIFIYMVLNPRFGTESRTQRLNPSLFYLFFGLTIGFYDGFFGPGTGSFWTLAFVALLGFDLRKATAHTKVMNFTSNIVSLIGFLIGGNVLISLGLIMGTGQILGAYLGSHLVLTRSVRFVRIFFLTIVALTILKLMTN